jgi:hypothetical protein
VGPITADALALAGAAPTLIKDATPDTATLTVSGETPLVEGTTTVEPNADALVVSGQQPNLVVSITVTVGGISITGTAATLIEAGTSWKPIDAAGATWSDVGSAGATIWTDVSGATGSWTDD